MSFIALTKQATLQTPAANKGYMAYDSTRGCWCWIDELGATWYFGEQRKVLAADLSGSTSTTLADVTGLVFPLLANTKYRFEFSLVWRTATATTGPKIGLTCPATPTYITAAVFIPGIAADGTAAAYSGVITASGDSVSGSGAEATNTDYEALVRGTIVNVNAGNLQLQWAAEVGAAGAVTPKAGSAARLWIP